MKHLTIGKLKNDIWQASSYDLDLYVPNKNSLPLGVGTRGSDVLENASVNVNRLTHVLWIPGALILLSLTSTKKLLENHLSVRVTRKPKLLNELRSDVLSYVMTLIWSASCSVVCFEVFKRILKQCIFFPITRNISEKKQWYHHVIINASSKALDTEIHPLYLQCSHLVILLQCSHLVILH